MTVVQSVFDSTAVSFSFIFDFKKAMHFSILKLSFVNSWWGEKDLISKTIHSVIGQLPKIERVCEEVEKTFFHICFSRSKIDAISVFLDFRLWQRIIEKFEESDEKKKNFFDI